MVCMISYDLMNPGQDYTKLDSAILAAGGRRILRSQWILVASGNANDVWKTLTAKVDNNDKLLITELTRDAQWRKGALLIDDATMLAFLAKARC